MSALGYHKAQLTKAGNALRATMARIDSTIMERVVLTGDSGTDVEAVYDRKKAILSASAIVDRAVSLLKSRRQLAQEFVRENPDEHGEFPLLDAIQDHWDANDLDQAMEEAETLLVRLEVAAKLLPTPEAISISALGTPQRSVQTTAEGSHTSVPLNTQGRPSDPGNTAPGVPTSPALASDLPRSQTEQEEQRQSQPGQGHSFSGQYHSPFNPSFATHPPGLTSYPPGFYNGSFVSGQNFIPLNASAFEQPLKLPAFELPEFHGEIDAFPQFWDLFATAVHNNTSVPVTLKFMYLKAHLKGTAANLISNFQPTAQNYEDAVRILLNTYYRPEILRSRLWDKLVQQRASADSAISQRITLCAIQSIWSQMKHVAEDPSAIGTLKLIRSKFPSRTREKVGELKSKGDSLWTVDELLKALDKVIEQLEVIEDADPTTDSSYNIVSSVRQGSRSPSGLPASVTSSAPHYQVPTQTAQPLEALTETSEPIPIAPLTSAPSLNIIVHQLASQQARRNVALA
ncbi:hypothetical protein Y032_0029g1978 [Ancylostoma ceylanicum]|uniref:Uncharacterized protein n=1 Tax=Ancylostoma ceylanicum TaxID=53326 RepID=A0A016USQ8_9BILA|nr:hypothetical protein Y032_0029g1978 [Ancylostoma ceylanicum]